MVSDPFTKLYTRIEKEFKDSKVNGKKYTWVSWNSSRDPEPERPTESEVPELQLRPSGGGGLIGADSAHTDFQMNFDLLINTGDRRLGYLMFPVLWDVLHILHQLKYVVLDDLEWNGESYFQSLEIVSTSMGLSNAELNRGFEGWTAMFQMQAFLQFSRTELES